MGSTKLFSRPEDVLLICHERDYHRINDRIPVNGGIYMGVIGSIDSALGQISELKPDLSLLFDINPHVITYFDFRTSLVPNHSDGAAYWSSLGQLLSKAPSVSKSDVLRLIKENGRINLESIPDIINRGNWHGEVDDYLLDAELSRGWSSPERYGVISSAVRGGKIKGFNADICKEGFNIAYKAADETGFPINLIYLSNILRYLSDDQRNNIYRNLETGLEEGIIGKDCRIVEYDSFETELIEPRKYLGLLGEAIMLGKKYVNPVHRIPLSAY